MTRVETYLNENLRKRLDQVEQVKIPVFLFTNKAFMKDSGIINCVFV